MSMHESCFTSIPQDLCRCLVPVNRSQTHACSYDTSLVAHTSESWETHALHAQQVVAHIVHVRVSIQNNSMHQVSQHLVES